MTDIALFNLDDDGIVTFGFSNIERVISGPEEALQVAAYHLLSTEGTNSYDRDDGAGLQKLIRGSMKSIDEIRTDAAISVSKAMANIRRTQSDDKPADSMITNLRLLDVNIDRTQLQIEIKIRIDLMDGNSFQTTFRVT